jgi:hypothetical protein
MKRDKIISQLKDLIAGAENELRAANDEYLNKNKKIFDNNMELVSAAFNGSWLGYHANIYYESFSTPVAGDHFSPEWGFMMRRDDTSSGWREMTYEQVENAIFRRISDDYKKRLNTIYENAKQTGDEIQRKVILILRGIPKTHNEPNIDEFKNDFSKIVLNLTIKDVINHMSPRGGQISRDSTALSQGWKTPPHVNLLAWHVTRWSIFDELKKAIKTIDSLIGYLDLFGKEGEGTMTKATKIFIGHGGSTLWKELKEFLNDRLKLQWDEFNRESPAGLATKEKLNAMLNDAQFAFLIMTAEDEHVNQTQHARENVIHEIGLFQGRLGFERAIVLLENGCSEFTNIIGLNQIRFDSDNLKGKFEEIRMVLEREDII